MNIQSIRFPFRDKRGRFTQVEAIKFDDIRTTNWVFVSFGLFVCFILAAYCVKIVSDNWPGEPSVRIASVAVK